MELKKLNKKFISFLLSITFILSFTNTVFADPVGYGEEIKNIPNSNVKILFKDVPQDYWAYKYIADIVNRKIMKGYPDGLFRPDNFVSRAEFSKWMVLATGLQPKKVNYSSFEDVKTTDWYSPFIETAKNYLTGYWQAGKYIYNPKAPALREDVAMAIVKLKGYDVNRLPDRSIIEAMFTDYEGISEGVKDYVSLAIENGLMSGYSDGTFKPQQAITRAETAAVLWRAFQYGNDNKTVNGNNMTIPTEAVTDSSVQSNNNQPSTNNPNNKIPVNQPNTGNQQSVKKPSKFSVDTLGGGIGKGDVDGPVHKAKINSLNSMIVDKNDNIYFLDCDTKKIRKLDTRNGILETYMTIDNKFNFEHSEDGKNYKHYDYTDFHSSKLAYNPAQDKLYLAGFRDKDSTTDDYGLYTIHEINPIVQMEAYKFDYIPVWLNYDSDIDFIKFSNKGDIIYSIHESGPYYRHGVIYEAKSIDNSEEIASSRENTGVKFIGKIDAVMDKNNIYIFDIGNRTLTKIQLFPRKVETVVKYDNISFDSITAYNGKFYLSSGATIYELGIDGKKTVFVDGEHLKYNDGEPIKTINNFGFDSMGNIILYDQNSNSIRRINLNENGVTEVVREKSISEEKLEIVKKMIKKGLDTEMIVELTGLSIKEVEALR